MAHSFLLAAGPDGWHVTAGYHNRTPWGPATRTPQVQAEQEHAKAAPGTPAEVPAAGAVGRYSDTSPILLCTDGGHFDNLGLVVLLRLRCRTIHVIHTSGDKPPLATTLAQTVTLAYEELGVRITFGEQNQRLLDLVPQPTCSRRVTV
ncbi:hypothetical protein ACFWTC_36865 [Streptomyces sp. NPDC058619]|uniref:hypothetical protein n=1 Tax=unclassified Streptomyces TaxID=2593676 RepID=UPI003657A9F1